MFSPQNVQAMSYMQQAVANMRVPGQTATIPVHSTSPVNNFTESFQNFLQAQENNPEIRWRSQLLALRNMGFTNTEQCIIALQERNGIVSDAVTYLIQQEAT